MLLSDLPGSASSPIRAFLESARAFRHVERPTLMTLARSSRFVNAEHGALLLDGDTGSAALCLMRKGHAAVMAASGPAAGQVVELPGAGEMFGEEHVVGAAGATEVRLLGDALALVVPGHAVLLALDESPGLARALLENLSRRSVRMVHRLEWQANRRAVERLAGFIMQQLPAGDEPKNLRLPAPKTILASLLSMTKESFSRCLAQLVAEARILVRGKLLHVPRPWRVAEVCGRGGRCTVCAECPRGGLWQA